MKISKYTFFFNIDGKEYYTYNHYCPVKVDK